MAGWVQVRLPLVLLAWVALGWCPMQHHQAWCVTFRLGCVVSQLVILLMCGYQALNTVLISQRGQVNAALWCLC